jgi:hypothetical protein
MIVYKIRDKGTGLYSTGGTHPNWSETGKVWKRPGDVTSHLNMIAHYTPGQRRHIMVSTYGNAELVEFELTERELSAKPVINHIIERKEKLEREAEARAIYREEQEKKEREKLYYELRQEFGE